MEADVLKLSRQVQGMYVKKIIDRTEGLYYLYLGLINLDNSCIMDIS